MEGGREIPRPFHFIACGSARAVPPMLAPMIPAGSGFLYLRYRTVLTHAAASAVCPSTLVMKAKIAFVSLVPNLGGVRMKLGVILAKHFFIFALHKFSGATVPSPRCSAQRCSAA
jgi:hypothetical protein